MPSTAFRIAIINKTFNEPPNLSIIYGIGFNILQGSLDTESMYEVEELTAAGVDGRRIRLVRKLDGPLVLRITESLTSSTPYSDYERDVRQYNGRLVGISLIYNGSRIIFNDVFLRVSIAGRLVGEVVGFGGGPNTKAIQYDIEILRS